MGFIKNQDPLEIFARPGDDLLQPRLLVMPRGPEAA
jgi:hypothetical protein